MLASGRQEPFALQGTILKLTEWDRRFQVFAGFSTKNGGLSEGPFASLNLSYTVGDDSDHVLNNRRLLAELTPIPYEAWVYAQQRHTNHIRQVGNAHRGAGVYDGTSAISDTDGLFTTEKNMMLATFHADCTPIYFYNPDQAIIGLVHAGWQGTAKEITRVFIETWQERGIDPATVYMAFGPAASAALYEIDEPVYRKIEEMDLATFEDALIPQAHGKYLLDTAYLNYLVALQLGVPASHMLRSHYCTIREEELFFSYRRGKKTGRMLAFISQ